MSVSQKSRAALFIPAIVVCAVLALGSCSPARAKPAAQSITGQRLELDLVPGSAFHHSLRFIIFRVPLYPQIACWVETPDGTYMGTIYATAKAAKKAWFGAPSAGRPEALPVWYHARQQGSGAADAVSGATPAGTVQVQSPLPTGLTPGMYVIKLEINSSFDYNERYTRANSGVNGQPSVVYSGQIVVGKGEAQADLAPIGTGSVDGSDGNIRPGLEGITTALQMLQSARVQYHEQ
ncbi:MAG: hypothetical protein ACLQCB_09855 [Spirochaetia bacterium]